MENEPSQPIDLSTIENYLTTIDYSLMVLINRIELFIIILIFLTVIYVFNTFRKKKD